MTVLAPPAPSTSPLGLPLRGADRPRVETHPEYAYSYGEEAAELMRRARHPLDDWQADSVELMLACQADGQWAHFEYAEWVPRQNGKGGALQARAITGFLLLGEELILWSAHLYKTAVEMFRRVKKLIRALGRRVKPNDDDLWWVPALVTDKVTGEVREEEVLVKVTNANDNRGFERMDTGARIQFIARSAGGGRGMSGDLNIVDETFDYDQDEHAALLYTLSARPNPQIIYTSTPPLRGDAAPIMYELRRRGDPTAPREPEDGPWEQDESLGYRDWGHPGDLEDLQVDVDDLSLAAGSNPALGIRITWKTVRNELKSDRAGYPRERLGIWPRELRSEVGILSAEEWAALADKESRRVGEIAIAVDVSPERNGAIAICGRRPDGLAHWELIEDKPGTDWIVDRVVSLKKKHNPVVVAIDGKGPAGSLISDLQKKGIKPSENPQEPKHGDLLISGAQDMADAWGKLVDATKQKTGRHRDQPQLAVALSGAKVRNIGDGGRAWGRKGSTNIAPLVAVTLAHWAYETRAHLVQEERVPNIW